MKPAVLDITRKSGLYHLEIKISLSAALALLFALPRE
jgi:hypothetical protein